MKDNCRLIEDLYPLYIEGELSPSVKKMVEEHLASCPSCAAIYESGEGFSEEVESNATMEEVPKSLDDRVKMKIKLRRVSYIAAILGVILAMMLLNKYENSRQEVFKWSDQMYGEAEALIDLVEKAKYADIDSLRFNNQMYVARWDTDTEAFNWFERERLDDTGSHLIIQKGSLYTTLETLQKRQKDDRWDDVDQEVYRKLKEYSYQYSNVVGDEYQKFHHGYSSYFQLVDFKALDRPVESINELTYHYNRFHKLPENVKRLSTDEIKERIGSMLKVKSSEIQVETHHRFEDMGMYPFHVNRDISGEIDIYTGNLVSYRYHDGGKRESEQEGERISEDEAREQLTTFLKTAYGKGAELSLEYKGMNRYGTSGHAFVFTLMNDGYPLLSGEHENFIAEVNAFTGRVENINVNRTYIADSFFTKDFKENLSPEEGLKLLHKRVEEEDGIFTVKRRYEHTGTFVIPSTTTGDYELVHEYDLVNEEEVNHKNRDRSRRYINAENGEEEYRYEPMH
ncbi:anti-sigma factor [Pseudalkalibacillus sp. SCS-8]|uniref:anti-sigma factor family protein n=1 Tax=Pseudalkalibacillus nanhaiensis TaxID=3115291 RepID=UPI0032DAB343